MMTQEEYVERVLALKRQGWTIKEIASETGYHPQTVSQWLKNGGPPRKRSIDPVMRVVDERWAKRITELIQPPADKLLATSVYEIISAEGFCGSYPSVARFLNDLRGARFRKAPAVSVPIETGPGLETQFDWSDCSEWTQRWGLGEVWCLGCVLCWSRWRRWWFTTSIDACHTFEGLVRFFESAGGTTKVIRTDRMGALGRSQGKRFKLHPPAIDFCRHHGLEFAACKSADAKRKGKIERPFRPLKESFLTELDALGAPSSVGEINVLGERWLDARVHTRPHSTTKVAPAQRLETERRFLGPLPTRRFDSAYREDRRVHPRLCLVEWDGVAYSVPPEVLGSKVHCRLEVDSDVLEIFWGTALVARHVLCPEATEPVWDPAHRQAAEAIALGHHRPLLRRLDPPAPDPATTALSRLELGDGDYDVDVVDLAARYGGCGCTGRST
jgi:transposase